MFVVIVQKVKKSLMYHIQNKLFRKIMLPAEIYRKKNVYVKLCVLSVLQIFKLYIDSIIYSIT